MLNLFQVEKLKVESNINNLKQVTPLITAEVYTFTLCALNCSTSLGTQEIDWIKVLN